MNDTVGDNFSEASVDSAPPDFSNDAGDMVNDMSLDAQNYEGDSSGGEFMETQEEALDSELFAAEPSSSLSIDKSSDVSKDDAAASESYFVDGLSTSDTSAPFSLESDVLDSPSSKQGDELMSRMDSVTESLQADNTLLDSTYSADRQARAKDADELSLESDSIQETQNHAPAEKPELEKPLETSFDGSEKAVEKSKSDQIDEKFAKETLETEEINELKNQYFDELSKNSLYPDTIDKKLLESKWEKLNPDEVAIARDAFQTKKADLIKSWEEKNNKKWPTYDKDVYSENGRLIRKQGSKFDAHHIQPISLGGKNSQDNITPLAAKVHYDRQGIHSPQSPYSSIAAKLAFEE